MSATSLSVVDAWRMVSAGRRFAGTIPLSSLTRLAGLLADSAGDCRYLVEFGRDASGSATVDVVAEAELPLICQRSLERFLLPVRVSQQLGLIADESEESALPPDVEPALVGADGAIRPLELVEDELILAVPTFPVKPGTDEIDAVWSDGVEEIEEEEPRIHPFAALGAMKSRNTLGD